MRNEQTERLLLALKRAGLTKAQLARLLRTSPQAVGNWIRRGVPGYRLFDVARALGVRAEWLATGEGPMVDERPPEEAPSADEKEAFVAWRALSEEERAAFLELAALWSRLAPDARTERRARLLLALRRRGLTQSQFAALLGVTPQTVNNWLKHGVPKDRLPDVARVLGVRAEWLATGEGPMVDERPPEGARSPDEEAVLDAWRRLDEGDRKALLDLVTIWPHLAPEDRRILNDLARRLRRPR